jgi:tetratricopeptide (TPR) repeat protein
MKFSQALQASVLFLLFFTGCAHMQQNSGLKTYVRGFLSEEDGKTDEAVEYYKETIHKAGEHSYVYVKLGNLYLKKQDTAEAKRSFFRAARLNPERQEAFFGLGVAYLMEKNNRLAAIYMEKGLELEPENHSVRMLLCDIYVSMDKLDESVKHYNILLETYPNNYILHYNYGNLLERIGKPESAERSYLKAVELSNFFWKGYFSLGLLCDKQGREEDAVKYFSRAIELNPEDSFSYSYLAGIYYKKENYEKARHYLEEAVRNGIKTPEFYNFLGVLYSEEENYEKAEGFFKKGIEIEDNSSGRFYLGTLYEKTNRRDQMEVEIKKAIEIDPDNAIALNYLGYTYLLEDRNLKLAYTMIKKACKIEPDNGAFLDSLGWAYYKMGSYERSREYLEKAASLEEDAEIYEHLGYLYIELKDYIRALYWFVRAYEMSNNKDLLKVIEEVKRKNQK